MRITRVEIKNYKGIAHKEFPVGERGAIIRGKGGSGKTSIVDAMSAALAGEGVDASCIRDGADRSEILIDMDSASVRRVLRRNGDGDFKTDLKTDGLGLGKSQSRLDDLFGHLLDPLALAKAKPADRRRMVLSAMPVTVTAEDLKRWTAGDWTAEPEDGKHGLDIVAGIRKVYYSRRTVANAKAEDAATKMADAVAERDRMMALVPGGPTVTLAEAESALRSAQGQEAALKQQQAQAEAQEKKSATIRLRIDQLNAAADGEENLSQTGPTPEDLTSANTALASATELVEKLQRDLEAAQQAEDVCQRKRDQIADAIEFQRESERKANDLRRQADDLRSSLAAVAISPVSPEQFQETAARIADAVKLVDSAKKSQAADEAVKKASDAEYEAESAKREAENLDSIVESLTKTAPSELAERSNMIPGLTFVDDDIALDGHTFRNLCGTETIKLCVEVAKRASPKGKLLRVNGLEQINGAALADFVKVATAGGWQLIGTRVEDGELQVVAIDGEDGEVAQPAQAE